MATQTKQGFGMMDSHKHCLKMHLDQVSDFKVEGYGYLFHEEKAARLPQKDGYFNSETFLKQVEEALDVFECRFLGVIGIFLLTVLGIIENILQMALTRLI